MVAVLTNQREVILDAVRRMYTEVATSPAREFHFPTGRRACELVGYPTDQLDLVPPSALESFAGRCPHCEGRGVIVDPDLLPAD